VIERFALHRAPPQYLRRHDASPAAPLKHLRYQNLTYGSPHSMHMPTADHVGMLLAAGRTPNGLWHSWLVAMRRLHRLSQSAESLEHVSGSLSYLTTKY